MHKILLYLKEPYRFLLMLDRHRIITLPDEVYLKWNYKAQMGKELDLNHPKTYNEKLQWLKLYDKKDLYTTLVDKYEVKEYVSKIIGEEYLIPTLGVWEKFEDIDFDKLPNQFVLKCTHDSGGVVIVKDKKNFDIAKAKKKVEKSMKKNFFYVGREWPYKNVTPRIIAEEYMEDKKTKDLRDYKFFAFSGDPKLLFIATERQNENEETQFDFFDLDFNHLDVRNGHPNAKVLPKKPSQFKKMISLTKKLAKGIPHVRVDFYEVNGKIYFGEMTFAHWSGVVPFEPEEWDYKLGKFINLPKNKRN